MNFKIPESHRLRVQKDYKDFMRKYIYVGDKKIHVSELEDRSVTYEMKQNMRMNSYAQDDLYPKLDDNTLVEVTKYYLSQCGRPNYPCSTYDEALIHKIVPELIKRLDEMLI